MKRFSKSVSPAAGAAVVLLLAACGGSSGPSAPTPVAAPTPAPCTQSLLLEGSGSLPARAASNDPIQVAAAGRVDITVDWTFAASPIGVYFVQGACSLDQFNARSCNFLSRSEPGGAKPRRLSAPNVAAGSYSLIVANFASVDEALSIQVFRRSETCPAAGGETGAAARGGGETVESLRTIRR